MLNLNEEQIIFLRDNFENAEEMINSKTVNDILLPLDALITYQGFDDDYLLNKWGKKAQRIYDEIYMQNEV